MLYNQHGIAFFYQFIEYIEQMLNVLEVQARRRFIEDVEGLACVFFGELGSQLHPLRFSAREGSGMLP
jgi:hypothetical protein